MIDPGPRILPLSEKAVVVEFGREISDELNAMAIGLSAYLEEHPFPGLVETVPAYSSTTIFFDPCEMQALVGEEAQTAVRSLVDAALAGMRVSAGSPRAVIEIPVVFDDAAGPDLRLLAESSGLAVEQVVDVFTSAIYKVYMIGFLPGFAYMGEVDARIRIPRKATPRLSVPKGSVGIAGSQTGIYPLESPGGWQLIGRTGIELFTPRAARPSLLSAGDIVRFVTA